jgi:hypothetical protein
LLEERLSLMRGIVKAKDFAVKAKEEGKTEKGGLRSVLWRLRLGDTWTVPVVELTRGEPKGTVIVLNDAGRKAGEKAVEAALKAGRRVLAVDPFYFGESKLASHEVLFALLLAATGDRPLGLQASQVAAVARWAKDRHGVAPEVRAVGPRTSLIALVATGLEPAVGAVTLQGTWGSLKEVLETNRGVNQMPEVFCFGLLERFDVLQLAALAGPRRVELAEPSERARKELAPLAAWRELLSRR